LEVIFTYNVSGNPSERPTPRYIVEQICGDIGINPPELQVQRVKDKFLSNIENKCVYKNPEYQSISCDAQITCMKRSDAQSIWCGCKDGSIAIISPIKNMDKFKAHDNSVFALDHFGNIVCSLSQGSIKLWDSKTRKLLSSASYKGIKRSVLFVKSMKHLNIWTGGGNNTSGQLDIWIWQESKKSISLLSTIDLDSVIQCMSLVTLSYDIKSIWVGASEFITVIDPQVKKVVAKWIAHPHCNVQSILSIGSNVWSHGNNKIIVWNNKTYEKLCELVIHQIPIYQLHMVQSMQSQLHVWSVYIDNNIVVWCTSTYKYLASTKDSVQGKRILSLHDNGNGGVLIAQLEEKNSVITCWEIK